MTMEKIGQVKFFPDTSSPEPGTADASFTTDCETDHLCLLIDLDTKNDDEAIARGRRIVQLWQLSEGMVSDEKLAAIFQHAEIQNELARAQTALLDEVCSVIQALKNFFRGIVGRGRAPGPSLQSGPVSRNSDAES